MERDDLLQKWLNGTLTPEEQIAFNALDDAPFLREILEEGKRFSAEKYSKVSDFKTLENRLAEKKKFKWLHLVPKIAAVLLISFAVFHFITNSTTTFTTEYSENKKITLPDNSLVQLNEFTSIEYKAKNWEQNRSLQLNGEAFFDVEKGSRFDVNTPHGIISVLGTEFNVLSRDSIFKVSCYEGLVQVLYHKKTIQLPAGSEFVLKNNSEEKTSISIVTPQWINNKSIFEHALIENVIAELEKQYNVNIVFNTTNNNLYFTGAFTHNNIDSALKAITQPFNLTYKIKNKTEIIISDESN